MKTNIDPRHQQAINLAGHIMAGTQQLIELLKKAKSVRNADGTGTATQYLNDLRSASDYVGRALAEVSRNAVA